MAQRHLWRNVHLRGSSWDRGLSWSCNLGFGCRARGDGEWADRPRLFSPERARANSPVHDFLFPSPKARDFVSFGLDDILHTAASDSEDCGPALADALPPSGQEARPSAAYSELVDVLSRATEKLALDWSSLTRHSDSPVALPSRMGASTGGIAVGSPHNSNRLHSSVWEKSPPLRRG